MEVKGKKEEGRARAGKRCYQSRDEENMLRQPGRGERYTSTHGVKRKKEFKRGGVTGDRHHQEKSGENCFILTGEGGQRLERDREGGGGTKINKAQVCEKPDRNRFAKKKY